MVSDRILAEAKKYIPECDYIVDLFDLMFIWVSDKALKETGFTKDEILRMRNLDLIAEGMYSEVDLRKQLIERITKKQGENTYILKTAKGLLNVRYQYQAFQFDGGWYITGKILETSPAPNPQS